ncbi:MAG: carboxypeptidase regulatory-like domain-containing protein [Anaerolineaceae bacterium]
MKQTNHRRSITPVYVFIIIVVILSLLSSCSKPGALLGLKTPVDANQIEVQFKVSLQNPLLPDSHIMLELVDDLTGVYFNSTRVELTQANDLEYSIVIPLAIFSDVKYRYVRVTNGTTFYEYNGSNEQVRYRILHIESPLIVEDLVTAWSDSLFIGRCGRISGQVIDAANNAPIPNLIVTAGGSEVLTSSDGSFLLNNLPPGTHNLVVYSMDGVYSTFQQGARVEAGADTPARIFLVKRPTTEVDFIVSVPRKSIQKMPLRFVSNLSNLGNPYHDLSSGSAGSAVNYPVMTSITMNRYHIHLTLPVGFHLRYKYSYGDGFWNAELDSAGNFVVRDQFISQNTQIHDRVKTFTKTGFPPVTINVKVPENTPLNETVSLQLNPFGWLPPLPMVDQGSRVWSFTILSPLQYVNSIGYRFCRNGQCEVSAESNSENRTFTPLSSSQTINTAVISWQGISDSRIDSSKFLLQGNITPHPGFMAGFELSPLYLPEWQAFLQDGIDFIDQVGADWIIISPTATYSLQSDLPSIQIKAGLDMKWDEMVKLISNLTVKDKQVILFPIVTYTQSMVISDSQTLESEDYWITLFDRYQDFLYTNADLAQFMGCEGLIVNDFLQDLPPAPPDVKVAGIAIEDYINLRTTEILNGLRARFSGQLIGEISLNQLESKLPGWIGQVDELYITFTPSPINSAQDISDLEHSFEDLLDSSVKTLVDHYQKPAIIGVAFPSSSENRELEEPQLNPTNITATESELSNQAQLYSALLTSVASRDWIAGFFSRGLYPYVSLQDTSATVYRKPASEILWFWYHFLLNKTIN